VAPEAIAAEVARCVDAGASVAHLHVRNRDGEIIAATDVFRHTLDLIFERRDIVVNGSTGGASELTREERCTAVTDARVEIASLNMGSTNFGEAVYVNTLADIRFWAAKIRDAGVVPELEIFAAGGIETARLLRAEGVLEEPLHFNVCLGFPGATPATPRHLAFFADLIGAEAPWGFLHEGMTDLRLIAAALGHGATVLRVGYEDGGYLRADEPARSNAELVERLSALIRAAGAEPATVDEARSLLGTRRSRNEGT
jgi:3-keto-5-aminohexanoate cleavage enzyme